MSTHPGASITWSLRSRASSAMHIWGKKLRVIFHRRHLCIDGLSYCGAHHKLLRAHSDMAPFRVLCTVRTWLQSCWWFRYTLLFVQLSASSGSSRCKHDLSALSWLNAEPSERAPTPLFGRLVRCSAHERSFARLWYMRFKGERSQFYLHGKS